MSVVPKLRFPEFDGEWKQVSVEDILQVTRGKVLAMPLVDSIKSAEKPYPVYSSQTKMDGLAGFFSEYLFEDAITWTTDGANAGEVRLRKGKFYCTNVCGVLLSEKGYVNNFISEAINRVAKKHVSYVGNPKLMNGVMARIPVVIPSLPEQQKIASFLSSIDKKIDLLRQKKDALELYKKGLMQKIFSQEIRFKQDDGNDFPDWEEVALGEIVDRVKRKNTSGNTNVLTISAQMGLVNQLDYFNKSVSSANLSGYTLLQNGDFAYNKSYSNGYPVGAIKRQIRYDLGVVSPLYICFRPHDHEVGNYLEIYLDSYFVVQDISKIMQEGARNHGLINISVSDFFDFISIPLPCSDERQKITSYFGALDAKLKIASSQVEQMETFKKGLLQQMFV